MAEATKSAVVEPKVEQTDEEKAVAEREARKKEREEAKAAHKAEVLKQAQEILEEYGGQESNIPINSTYWTLMNDFRSS